MTIKRIFAICLIFLILLGTIPFSIPSFAVDNNEEIEELEEYNLYNRNQLKNLVAGEDYIENEIIICCKEQDQSPGLMPDIFTDYDLTLDYCLSN